MRKQPCARSLLVASSVIMRLPFNLLSLLALFLVSTGCGQTTDDVESVQASSSSDQKSSTTGSATEREYGKAANSVLQKKNDVPEHGLRFRKVAQSRGIGHTYDNGAAGHLLMFESIGGGAGWLDVQLDGKPDLFCTQGGSIRLSEVPQNPTDTLFSRPPGSDTFQQISDLAGILANTYGQGVTIGDFDNDGFEDIFVTNLERNQLWHNCGDGTFVENTAASCCQTQRWSASAAWADVDLDGDLDLYVCNYLKYDPHDPLPCEKDGQPALCHPRQLDSWPDEFYRNNGDGTLSELSESFGLKGDGNKALGVVVTDLNLDGYPDIYVANDTTANFYFVNQQDGTFIESSLRLGGGMNAAGALQASMGIAAGDYDRNGMMDLFLTHFSGESNTLYQNLGNIGLHDVSGRTGLMPISTPKLGFGTVMGDFDRNGQSDLIIANGHIDSNNADGDGFEQQAQILTFDGRRWHDVSADVSDFFQERSVGRGIASADYDGDGDMDLVIVNQNTPLELLENQSKSGRWLTILPVASTSNRSNIGLTGTATVNGESWTETIAGGTSFCSSHQHRLYFGFGEISDSHTVTLNMTWPGKAPTTIENVKLDQVLVVREP